MNREASFIIAMVAGAIVLLLFLFVGYIASFVVTLDVSDNGFYGSVTIMVVYGAVITGIAFAASMLFSCMKWVYVLCRELKFIRQVIEARKKAKDVRR